MTREIVSESQVVFDKDEAPDYESTLIVVDPDAGTVGDQKGGTYDAIKSADGNAEFNTSDSVDCVKVQYCSPDLSGTVYTFPVTRLYVPERLPSGMNWPPVVRAKADMLLRMFEQAGFNEMDVFEAGVEGQVLLAAKAMASERDVDVRTFDDTSYTEEIFDCPECDHDLHLDGEITSAGDGTAYAEVVCSNCEWAGAEEWVHVATHPDDSREDEGKPSFKRIGETDLGDTY